MNLLSKVLLRDVKISQVKNIDEYALRLAESTLAGKGAVPQQDVYMLRRYLFGRLKAMKRLEELSESDLPIMRASEAAQCLMPVWLRDAYDHGAILCYYHAGQANYYFTLDTPDQQANAGRMFIYLCKDAERTMGDY